MKQIKSIFGLFLMISLFISCAKDGDTGPQGPAGAKGADGVDGNANVKTQTFSVVSVDWYYSAPSFGVDITDNDITQDIVDYGMVMVYLSNGSGGWQAMPFTAYPASSYSSSYIFVHYLNGVTIWKTDSDLTQPSNPGARTFKVIAISEALRVANPLINWLDYNQVKQKLNLAD